jgi:hypothetical protein
MTVVIVKGNVDLDLFTTVDVLVDGERALMAVAEDVRATSSGSFPIPVVVAISGAASPAPGRASCGSARLGLKYMAVSRVGLAQDC